MVQLFQVTMCFYKFPPTPAALKGDLRPKIHHCFYDIISMILWRKKELCTKFCGVLISSHEVMKLKSFEQGVSDVILENL